MTEGERQKEMIQEAVAAVGLTISGWTEDEDGARAELGRWYAMDDDPGMMFESGDEGALRASVVGAQRYGNERVYFGFMPEGMDCPVEVRHPLDTLEPVA